MTLRFPAPASRHRLPLVNQKHSLRRCSEGLRRWNEGLQSVGLLGRLWRWARPDHRSPFNLGVESETQEIRDLKQEKDWTHCGWFEGGGATWQGPPLRGREQPPADHQQGRGNLSPATTRNGILPREWAWRQVIYPPEPPGEDSGWLTLSRERAGHHCAGS